MNRAATLSLLLFALALFGGEIARGPSDWASDIINQAGEDFNMDGKIDGRDVQALVYQFTGARTGVYFPAELAAALLHPDAKQLVREREQWLAARPDVVNDPTLSRVIQAALYSVELQFMRAGGFSDIDLRTKSLCERIARDWPGSLSIHDQTMWWIPDLCRIASLSPEARGILRPVLTRCLDDLRAGRIWGTNIGVGLRCRVWIARVLASDGITVVDSRGRNALDPLEDWGDASAAAHNWGLRSILAHITDDGLFNWDGTDLWYWWFTSRPALVAAGWHDRYRLPQAERGRFEAMYFLPIRMLCAGGAHPLIGSAKASPKAYRFFGGWVRDWPGADDASAWARKKIRVERSEPLRFDDLIYSGGDVGVGVDVTARPTMGRGLRAFGNRLVICENGDDVSVVVHFGDGNPINGGHQTPGPFPQVQEVRR